MLQHYFFSLCVFFFVLLFLLFLFSYISFFLFFFFLLFAFISFLFQVFFSLFFLFMFSFLSFFLSFFFSFLFPFSFFSLFFFFHFFCYEFVNLGNRRHSSPKAVAVLRNSSGLQKINSLSIYLMLMDCTPALLSLILCLQLIEQDFWQLVSCPNIP